MPEIDYLMENEEEALRLEMKTDLETVKRQVLWAGMRPGMRVVDLACGPGVTTGLFHQLVQPGGAAVGVDGSAKRIDHARKQHGPDGPEFVCRNLVEPLDDLGPFDFAWVRFFLEYHRADAFDIVKNITQMLKPGGMLFLLDLDHNALNHHGIPERLLRTITQAIGLLDEKDNFDSRMGVKLYSYLYDLGYEQIKVMMEPHHLIYGELNQVDEYNWLKKVEVIGRKYEKLLVEYENGYDEFYAEFKQSFANPRRFTYTPLIGCRGVRPL